MRLVQFASSFEEGVLYCDLAKKQYYALSIDEMQDINSFHSTPIVSWIMGLSSVICGCIAYFESTEEPKAAILFLGLAFVLSIIFSCLHTCRNQVRIGKEVARRRPIPFDYEMFRAKMKKSKKVYFTILCLILFSGAALCALLWFFLATGSFTAGILAVLAADVFTMSCLTLQPIGKIRVRRQIEARRRHQNVT